jgi:tetratricopeptide (TPR) repeat protein
MIVRNRLVCLAALAVALLMGGVAVAAPYVILPTGQKVEGTRIKAGADGQIVLTTADGQLSFPKGTKVFVDEPVEYGQALGLLEKRQYDEAAKLLGKVIDEYRFLGWDRKARNLQATAYANKGDFKSALAAYDALFAEFPDARKDDEAQYGYLKSLAGAGDREKMAPLLDEVIRTGPRRAAALAQVIRGNQKFSDGQVAEALLDFVRTADFFRDVPDVQAEASFMAGECLSKMGDARAAQYYETVTKEFAQSPFAKRIREREPGK